MSRSAMPVTLLCGLQFIDVMGATMVVTLLPSMLDSVGAGPSGATFISTGYAVAFGGFLVLGARLGDGIGHARVILVSSLLFAAAGILVTLAPTVSGLTLGRMIQGLAAAATVPAALALLTNTTEEGPRRQRAIAAWSAAGAAAGATGFVLGGVASAAGQWRASFLILGALAAVMGIMVRRLAGPGTSEGLIHLDLPGGVFLTTTVALVVAAAAVIEQHPILAASLAGGAMLAGGCLALAERRALRPILPIRVIRSSPVRRGSWVSFVNTATTSSSATIVTLFAQPAGVRSGLMTAAVLLPFSIAVIASAPFAPRLMERLGDGRTMSVGLVGIAAGTGALPLAGDSLTVLGLGMAAAGAGIGLSSSGATHCGTTVSAASRASAAAIVNTAAQLGTALGIALALGFATIWGHRAAWVALAGLAACVAIQSSRWSRQRGLE